MDSKYALMSDKPGASKFPNKRYSPIVFDVKNGNAPKKLKIVQNGKSDTHPTSSNILNNSLKTKINIQEQRKSLPIFAKRNKLLELVKRHNTLIIIGETGSGKSTQIPQYVYSARLQNNGCIAVTQPRRVAAVSLAIRVAQEHDNGMTVGDQIGYTVRFEDVTSDKTKIKYMTDGMLLRESMFDKLLLCYTFIILDEAHERTIHTDVLFGIVKRAQRVRAEKNLPVLKILIMSATMDVDHFSTYFNNCQVVYIEGRTYPVNIYYTLKPHEDYQSACIATFFKIHRESPVSHGVLIFLTGQEEIEAAASQIRLLAKDPDVTGPKVHVITLYAAQPSSNQLTVFQSPPDNCRKVVISTNIAETSLTIPDIRYVIDSGMVKVRSFHPSSGLELLKAQRISQEQAWQRSGRAGRESEGFCYRIYTRSQFELMFKSSVPEIQRANLNTVTLQLLAIGIHTLNFDFMNKPPKDAVNASFSLLKTLGAIDNISAEKLTTQGKLMAKFPLDPRFSKVLLSSQHYACVEEALTVVAFLSAESVLINPINKREQAKNVRQKFSSGYGDLLTLVNLYRQFCNVGQSNKRLWCHEHFINCRNILHVREIRSQLQEICEKCNISISTCGDQLDQLRKCLITGLFINIAELNTDRQYITLDKRQVVSIHPSSILHGQQPPLVLFTEVVQTTKCYLRGLTTIEAEWLQDVVPDYAKTVKLNVNK